jgi:copper homeostasis protein
MKNILEVCVDSYNSLKIAEAAGANRIELCSALNLGGLTPSYGLMRQAISHQSLEVVVMIRPRAGDFCYSTDEFETMKQDVLSAKELGFEGVVTGILHPDGHIDLERLRELVDLAKPMQVTLHRAFDVAKDPEGSMEALIDMGIVRILTSGKAPTALEGASFIRELQRAYGQHITIMPGSGVREDTIEELMALTGCTQFHLSGKVGVESLMQYRPEWLPKMHAIDEFVVEKADYNRISKVKRALGHEEF